MRVQNANGVRKNRTSTWTIRCQVTGNTFISRLQVLFWDTSTVVITRLSSRDFLGFSRSRFVCTGLIRLAVTLRYKAESTRTASHESQCVLGYLHIHTPAFAHNCCNNDTTKCSSVWNRNAALLYLRDHYLLKSMTNRRFHRKNSRGRLRESKRVHSKML